MHFAYFIDSGADVNKKDGIKRTPMKHATIKSPKELVQKFQDLIDRIPELKKARARAEKKRLKVW